MNDEFIPWDQYALLAYIAKFGDKNKLGKTAFQKLVFLFSQMSRSNFGYSHTLYTYGPYSADLASDLEFLAKLNVINISYDSSVNFHQIKSGPLADSVLEKSSTLGTVKENLDRFLGEFGNRTARQLELLATLVYLSRNSEEKRNDEQLSKALMEIKPKYKEDVEVKPALAELQKMALI